MTIRVDTIVKVSVFILGLWAFRVGAIEVFPQLHSKNLPGFPQAPVSAVDGGDLEILYNTQCYGGNMRAIHDPPNPGNMLHIITTLTKSGTVLAPIQIDFSVDLLDPGRDFHPVKQPQAPKLVPANPSWPITYTLPRRMDVDIGVKTNIPAYTASLGIDGKRKIDSNNIKVQSITVGQTGTVRLPRGEWGAGNDPTGPVSARTDYAFSNNGSTLSINIKVPGALQAGQRHLQVGFCDSWFSPLMLFFDEKKPMFTGNSPFAIFPNMGNFAWPEVGAPGFFLAIDKNGNGQIDSGIELFGENRGEGIANGFESLRKLDTNHDGHINAKDRDFYQLLLWSDKNGDGVSQKEEIIPLSKMAVVDIDLNYNSNRLYRFGGAAELRESSHFTYQDPKTDNLKKGEIFDVWLAPVSAPAPRKTILANTKK